MLRSESSTPRPVPRSRGRSPSPRFRIGLGAACLLALAPIGLGGCGGSGCGGSGRGGSGGAGSGGAGEEPGGRGPLAAPAAGPLLVFAAASLADVIRELGDAYTRDHGLEVELNLAGSNALARQIRATEGPDVFLSADRDWMDFVERAGRILPETRSDVFSNRLVIVARNDSSVRLTRVEDLATAAYRHLSTADPEAVPAGRYARAYLSAIPAPEVPPSDGGSGGDLWSFVEAKVVPSLDARAALALAESDPEIVGIVYRTDALSSRRVRILAEVPAVENLPIVYCAAALAGARNEAAARRFLAYLSSREGRAIVRRHGFLSSDPPSASDDGPAAPKDG